MYYYVQSNFTPHRIGNLILPIIQFTNVALSRNNIIFFRKIIEKIIYLFNFFKRKNERELAGPKISSCTFYTSIFNHYKLILFDKKHHLVILLTCAFTNFSLKTRVSVEKMNLRIPKRRVLITLV